MNVSHIEIGQTVTFKPISHRTQVTLSVDNIKEDGEYRVLYGNRVRPDGSIFGGLRLFIVKSTTPVKVVR